MDSENEVSNISDEIKRKVRDWLLEDDYSIEEKTVEGMAWYFVATITAARSYDISQREGKPDEVYIRKTVPLEKRVSNFLAKKSQTQRNEFYSDVRFMLLSLGVEFQPEGNVVWERVTISERIFYDALTKDEFLRRVMAVFRATAGLVWMSNDLVPNVSPGKDPSPGLGTLIH